MPSKTNATPRDAATAADMTADSGSGIAATAPNPDLGPEPDVLHSPLLGDAEVHGRVEAAANFTWQD